MAEFTTVIDLKIFPCQVIMALNIDSKDKLFNLASRNIDKLNLLKFAKSINKVDFKSHDYTLSHGQYSIIVIQNFNPKSVDSQAVLLHELHHAATAVGEFIGLPRHKKTEEFFAYLQDWLYTEVINRYVKYNDKKRRTVSSRKPKNDSRQVREERDNISVA